MTNPVTTEPQEGSTLPAPASTSVLDRLDAEKRQRAEQLAASLQFTSETGVLGFGVVEQKELMGTADRLMHVVSTKDAGPVGDALTELIARVRELEPESLTGYTRDWIRSAVAKVPVVNRWVDELEKFITRYEKIGRKVDQIVDTLERQRHTLVNDVETLKLLSQQISRYREELEMTIAAGEIALVRLNQELQSLKDNTPADDPAGAEKVGDLGRLVSALDRRLGDLRLAEHISFQTGAQIRLVKDGDQGLLEKIQSSLLTTIPLWKYQASLAISIWNQRRAREIQAALRETNDQLLSNMATLLQGEAVATARETERGIAEITTLKLVNDKLIATITDTQKAHMEGAKARQAARVEIVKMREELTLTIRREGQAA